ncbi:hypothetical protein MML48_3g00005270 [Holotrichia oblita]|uniref:Uncharacterized protein n=1 Tax=Holotrichia oblita TaxID=644536 RepID=A0ACB9TD48_HOLOL|nr:hypothetical protein MML48_3g00005270 [Holotrichia oblita]
MYHQQNCECADIILPFFPKYEYEYLFESNLRVTWFERDFSQSRFNFEKTNTGSNACTLIAVLLAAKCYTNKIQMHGPEKHINYFLVKALGESILEGNSIHNSLKSKGVLNNINLTVPEGLKFSGMKCFGLVEWTCNLYMQSLEATLYMNLKSQWLEWIKSSTGKKYKDLFVILICDARSVLFIINDDLDTMLPGIGLFGTGPVVRVLVPILRENGFKIEAIWSRTIQDAQDAAKELNIPFHTSKIDDVLLSKDVDLIFVLCSPNLHAQISVKALGIGKHIVCDKPAGLSQEDALKMVNAGQYYPTLISIISHSFRFLPAFIHMREAIMNNYLGSEIKLIDIRVQTSSLYSEGFDWKCNDIMGGGILNLIGSHVVDTVTFLTGAKALRVHGLVRTFTKTTDNINGIRQISAPDFCTFQMELERGILVTATMSSHSANTSFSHEVIISGTNGYLLVRGCDLFGVRGKIQEELYIDSEDIQSEIPNSILPRNFIIGLYKMIAALREAFLPVTEKAGWIKEPVRLAAGFEDGLYVRAVLSAIQLSSQTRQWVKVNIMTEQPDTNALLSAAVRKTAISIT